MPQRKLDALIAPDLIAALLTTHMFTTQVAGPISLRSFAIAAGEVPQPTDGPKVKRLMDPAAGRVRFRLGALGQA